MAPSSRSGSPDGTSPPQKPERLPLAFTLGTTLLLLLVPALLLRQLPRPQAFGLEKLMASVSLLQSFRADPDRPVPELWRERLGPEWAERLWRLQTRTWWQFWEGGGAGRPFLALSSRGMSPSSLPALAVAPLKVGDLVILAPDQLSRQLLSERLRPQVRPSPGLRFRCLPRLEREQAVFWRPAALGVLLGPLAPFLQDVQEGCLSLAIQSDGLSWSGEAASVEGMLLEVPESGAEAALPPRFRPSAGDPLLEVRGASLERLLAGLLARELIRQPLAERYGFGRDQVALLRQTPYRLVLRPLARGPFQASVELTVLVGGKEQDWKGVLTRLGANLQKEGLRPVFPPLAPAGPSGAPTPSVPPGAMGSGPAPAGPKPTETASSPSAEASSAPGGPAPPEEARESQPPPSQMPSSRRPAWKPWPSVLWTREDGVVVGGWHLRNRADVPGQITFFLGPTVAPPAPLRRADLPTMGGMELLVRPRELALRGLLPSELPEVVKRSTWLWVTSRPVPSLGPEAPLSQLQGSLELRP